MERKFVNRPKEILTGFLLTLFAFLTMLLSSADAFAQSANGHSGGSLEYLEQTFPKLTGLYHQELRDCHTHYIFAIDVSGSMIKYDDTVTPALQAFARALPLGEQVSIIPFGTDAKENTPGLCCKVNSPAQKQSLETSLSTLYINDGYTQEFRKNTDIAKAVAAISKTILTNQEAQMNVIVIITDFLNDLPDIGEQKLAEDILEELNKDFDNVTNNKYTRVVAMQLPKAGTGAGFCLDQLQEKVFCNTSITKKFDIVPVLKDKGAISDWFERLTREIMTDKLKAVINLDNERNLHPTLKTNININGVTTAEIHWTPNKLYREIKLDSTYVDAGSNYVFKNNKEVWQTTRDTVLSDIELGTLKCKTWGLRYYKEKLNIGMSLPTPYDDELTKLSIDKPIPATSAEQSGLLFTFFLSFQVCCALLIIFLIWMYFVYKTALYNKKIKIKGYLTVNTLPGMKVVIDKKKIKASDSITIGQGSYLVEGAKWAIKFYKIPGNSWLLKKAKWGYTVVDGAIEGKQKKIYNSPKVSTILNIGPDKGNYTHNIKIDK